MSELRFVGPELGGGLFGTSKSKRHLNKYRIIKSSIYGSYIEITIKNSETRAKCDVEDEYVLEQYVWRYHNDVIETIITEDGYRTVTKLKSLILDVKDHITHLNGDIFDCRKCNLKILQQKTTPELNYIDEKISIPDAPKIKKVGKWFGGKPGGCTTQTSNSSVKVRFSSPALDQNFTIADHGDIKKALVAATKFRYEEADRRGLVRNKMRIVTSSNEENYLEVQGNNDRTFICDLEDIKTVKRATWSITKNTSSAYYVTHSQRQKSELKAERFHNLVVDYPVVDHINGNGCDNRKINLRDGSGGTNARNMVKRKDNKSGVTGVTFTKGVWIVQWPEGGKRRSKAFGTSYGGIEAAKKAAITFRLQKNAELNIQIRQ